MRTRRVAATLAAVILSAGLGHAQAPLEFDIVSIKRKPAAATAISGVRRMPDGTVVTTNTTVRGIVAGGWPSEDGQFANLPSWADRDLYDVTVKPPAGATPEQIQEMWRTLLRQRLKLEAHFEMRDGPIYALVVARADGRLGPQLKPSPHDCAAQAAAPPAAPGKLTDGEVLASCGYQFAPGRMVSGGLQMSAFARLLRARVRRTVEDRTGLAGYWTFTMTYSPSPGLDPNALPKPEEPPSIFAAIQEQLGLKLESASKPMQTVVIDRIEPPTEN